MRRAKMEVQVVDCSWLGAAVLWDWQVKPVVRHDLAAYVATTRRGVRAAERSAHESSVNGD